MTSGEGATQDGRVRREDVALVGRDVHPEGVDEATTGNARGGIGQNGAVQIKPVGTKRPARWDLDRLFLKAQSNYCVARTRVQQ